MKKLIVGFVFFFLFLVTQLYAEGYKDIIVVSDLDDTLKITNTENGLAMVWNMGTSTKVFFGMDSLYRNIADKSDDFYILSNTKTGLKKQVNKLLKEHNLSDLKVILRDKKDKFQYKYDSIAKILKANPSKKLILIGDDSSEDHDVYQKIRKDFPGRILDIYIRPVRGRKLPKGIKQYYTAFDIALSETFAENSGQASLQRITNEMYSHEKKSDVLPGFVACPNEKDVFGEMKKLLDYYKSKGLPK